MRYGFTTGSCAAAAAKAAAYMLFNGTEKNSIQIKTPKGIIYNADIVDIDRSPGRVSCAVIKDGGDDPDVTSGAHVLAEVSIAEDSEAENTDAEILIDGGRGVGRVTKPGLDQPVGNAAINSVPRKMIHDEVLEVCRLADFHGKLSVVISVPEGEALAEKTFNPRLGITGGISIIGTSGIVEPMSMQAIRDTIFVELRQRRAQGEDMIAVAPGNYGRDFMQQTYGYDIDRAVKCSNFIGDTIDMTAELGFKSMLLVGNIGKLVKLAGGIMNTHSACADCRMEIIAAAALRTGMSAEKALEILDCVVTEEALEILKSENILQPVMDKIMEKIMFYLNKKAGGRLDIECIVYSNKFGELGKSKGADKWLTLSEQDREQ